MIAHPDRSAEADFDSSRQKNGAAAASFFGSLSKSTLPARPLGKGGTLPLQLMENVMLDFLNACLAAKLASRGGPHPGAGRGRSAVARLVIAFAIVAVLVGALDRQASGTALPPAFELAEVLGGSAG
jgi:hypothetical protein